MVVLASPSGEPFKKPGESLVFYIRGRMLSRGRLDTYVEAVFF